MSEMPRTDPDVRTMADKIDAEYGGGTKEFQGPDGDVLLLTDTGAAIWLRPGGEHLSCPVDWESFEEEA